MPSSAKENILSLHSRGMSLGLSRIEKACKLLGNPEKNFTTIHVCGTVGKGSTAKLISSILSCAGFKTGEFYSPHIFDFNERIQVNGKKIEDLDISLLYPKISKLPLSLSFFEFTTALALLHYKHSKCNYAVLEAGLGGRLDATKAARGKFCIITRIGFDHMHILGNSLKKIAREKCGLIRAGATVVTLKQAPEAMKEIILHCKIKKANLIISKPLPSSIPLSPPGSFQRENAGLAYSLAKELKIKESAIRKGFKSAKIPARMQTISKSPRILLDSAHNPDGFKALCAEIRKIPRKSLITLFCSMKDKDWKSSLPTLARESDILICTQIPLSRSEGAGSLYRFARNFPKKACMACESPHSALQIANALAGRQDLILITGSMYLLSELFGKDTIGM